MFAGELRKQKAFFAAVDGVALLNGQPQATIPIVTKAGVERAGFFGRLGQKIGRML